MSDRFSVKDTPLSGLKVLERKPLADQRGFLERMFCAGELAPLLMGKPILQINHSLTRKKGAVRGFHFQNPPHAETKIVTCLRGQVFDIAVDVRPDSPTYLKWHGVILGEDNFQSFFIPEGFAHGFQTLTENCELLYLHTAAYCPSAEGALNPRDPALGVNWPLDISELSQRDTSHPMIQQPKQRMTP